MNDADSEPQTGESKSKPRNRGKKRKRLASDSSTDIEDVLPENTLEVEKNLHASAIKNNLDDASVKKILKKVVTNDHVLALVKLREEEEDSGTEESLQPKITRAKAKELMKVSAKSAPWNLELTPIKHIPVKTRPEVKALIAQELPDDEDDDEYEPTNDDVPSDDDHMLESSSDLDSLPRTPATPRSLNKSSPKVVNDGPFKVPQQELTPVRRKLSLEEEPTIALRTRSKLSLSATSIEHIESSFNPPDDLPTPDVDSLWNDFLVECLNPASNARNEDDDEADPEYNVAADPDANDEDEESLENSIIKISKKELNDLMTELFNIMPDGASEQTDNLATDNIVQNMLTEETTRQTDVPTRCFPQDKVSDKPTAAVRAAPAAVKIERFSIGKGDRDEENEREQPTTDSEETQPENNENQTQPEQNAVAPPLLLRVFSKSAKQNVEPPSLLKKLSPKPQPIRVEIPKDSCTILPEQRLLLQQQLRQHVQLAAGMFLQLFVHPTHWGRAPIYKEYLESLEKMSKKVPNSIVNVCNLKPALELIISWEATVSADTKENREMVKFIQKEMERQQRRRDNNAYYVGDFPNMFMEVVANSTVFVYPHLLPGMPFRADYRGRRSTYIRSEDELLTVGLAQFWEYVYANPSLFKPPKNIHPRHRWGMNATLQLVSRHMMPWVPPQLLRTHILHVKRAGDKDNPICRFLETREVRPPQHRLLQFNPRLTLYEQPETEVPRIWVRYLAKNSARFKKFLYSRNKFDYTPEGVDVEVQGRPESKIPLSIDFTKKIPSTRLNLLPKKDAPLVNRIDVRIDKPPEQPLVATQIFTVVNTSNGTILVPLQMQTATVNSTVTPLSPPKETVPLPAPENAVNKDSGVEGTKTAERSNPKNKDSSNKSKKSKNIISDDPNHCSCCIQLRKICKQKKETIKDYFKVLNKSDNDKSDCGCNGKKYPRFTNRLKLLVQCYRTDSKSLLEEVRHTLARNLGDEKCEDKTDSVICDDDENDLVTALRFQSKLTMAATCIRNNRIKVLIKTMLSKFDVYNEDAVALAKKFQAACEQELPEYYKDFVGFLTAEQADSLGHFKYYFVQRCVEKLIKKIEEEVSDKQKRCSILWFLQSSLWAAGELASCDLCSELLWLADGHPALARYVFRMFPHRRRRRRSEQPQQQEKQAESSQVVVESEPRSEDVETRADDVQEPVETNTADELGHSSSDEDIELNKAGDIEKEDNVAENEHRNQTIDKAVQYVNEHECTPVKVEEEEIHSVSMTEASNDASDILDMRTEVRSDDTNMSRLIMSSDDETIIKSECPEWNRKEDKLVLEVIKTHLTAEEMRDKTLIEILEQTQALTLIADSLPDKSIVDIKDRIVYLLQLLVNGDHLQ